MTETPVKMKPVRCQVKGCDYPGPLYGGEGKKEWFCALHAEGIDHLSED